MTRGQIEPEDAAFGQLLTNLYDYRGLLGESFVPWFLNYIMVLECDGQHQKARQVMADLLTAIVETHRGEGKRGLPTPYYGAAEVADWLLMRGRPIQETFQWRSFTLRSLILLAVRLGLREELDYYWRVLSRISQSELVPSKGIDVLLWRVEEGRQVDTYLAMEQSWAQLALEASRDYTGDFPPVLRNRAYFLPLLMNVMPHRVSPSIAMTVFDALRKSTQTSA